jgi:hypothetical protein
MFLDKGREFITLLGSLPRIFRSLFAVHCWRHAVFIIIIIVVPQYVSYQIFDGLIDCGDFVLEMDEGGLKLSCRNTLRFCALLLESNVFFFSSYGV